MRLVHMSIPLEICSLGKANSRIQAIVTSKMLDVTSVPISFIVDIKCWSQRCTIFSSLPFDQCWRCFCSSFPSSSKGFTHYFSSSSSLSFHSLLEHSCVYTLSSISFCFLSRINWCFIHSLQVMEANKSCELQHPSYKQVVIHDHLRNPSMYTPSP